MRGREYIDINRQQNFVKSSEIGSYENQTTKEKFCANEGRWNVRLDLF